jgi:hypothetical protein
MPDIWTKTKAEFVIEMMHDRFGPKSTWVFASAPDRRGTSRRAAFDHLIEVLAEVIGCKPNGIRVTLNTLSGRTWPSDPNVRKWSYWIIGKALEIGFITPQEAPPIGMAIATDDEVPEEG